jgi:4-amino-4-deoxy-L-arabinose transferase-like glycosyltransferase
MKEVLGGMGQVKSIVHEVRQDDAGETQPHLPTLHRFSRQPWFDGTLAAIIGMVALGFALYGLGTASLSFDESWSVGLASQHLHIMWHFLWGLYQNMTLYYLFLDGWLRFLALVGLPPVEFAVRFPSALFAALGAMMVFLLGRRFWGRTVGIIAGLLYSVNYLQLYHAQNARAYSLQMLFLCIAWYALFTILTAQSPASQKRWWACYIGAITLGVYTQLFTALVFAAQLVAFGILLILPGPWRTQARRTLPSMLASVAIICILVDPIALDALLNGGESTWIPIAHLADIRNFFIDFAAGGNIIYIYMLAIACGLGTLAATLARWPWNPTFGKDSTPGAHAHSRVAAAFRKPAPGVFALLCWLIIPIAISYEATQPHRDLYLFWPRYLIAVIPALCLLAALGISALRWRIMRVAMALGLVLVALWALPPKYYNQQADDFRPAALWLQQHYQPGDGLACYHNVLCSVPMTYYLQKVDPGPAHFDPDSPGNFFWVSQRRVHEDIRSLADYGAKHARIFVIIVSYPASPVYQAEARTVQNWADTHYQLISLFKSRLVTIRYYTTGARAPQAPYG